MYQRIVLLLILPALTFGCTGNSDDDGGALETTETETDTDTVTGETGTDTGTGTGTGAQTEDADGTDDSGTDTGEPVFGIPILGDGTHDLANLDVVVISSPDDGLNFPTDLEFKPGVAGELWVTNREDNAIVIYENAGLPNQVASNPSGEFDNGGHFMAKPAALAFGADGTFATAQQEQTVTQPGDPADGSFMGPTLWTSDLATFQGGHQSHLDMLHNSPLSSGIAWESENTYWVYDGDHGSLTRYKFNSDHGLGGTDHTDGEIYRYADGMLGYETSIPSHVVLDSNYVYAADSQNGRIVRLDPTTASMANSIIPNYDGCQMNFMDGAELITLVDGAALDPQLETPAGLELVDDILFVTDPLAGRVYGFDLDGNLLDWLDTGFEPGSLMGMAFDDEGNMWIADAAANQVRKFSVPAG